MMPFDFAAIPGFEKYCCRRDGTVWRVSAKPGEPLPVLSRVAVSSCFKYQTCNLVNDNGRRITVSVHRMMALAFLGPPPFPGAQVRHLDGNPHNNSLGNLAYGTARDNWLDKFHTQTATVGDANASTKINEAEREIIMEQHRQGCSMRELGRMYGVSHTTIRRIVNTGRRLEGMKMDHEWESYFRREGEAI